MFSINLVVPNYWSLCKVPSVGGWDMMVQNPDKAIVTFPQSGRVYAH